VLTRLFYLVLFLGIVGAVTHPGSLGSKASWERFKFVFGVFCAIALLTFFAGRLDILVNLVGWALIIGFLGFVLFVVGASLPRRKKKNA
jgi:hypothetical protein